MDDYALKKYKESGIISAKALAHGAKLIKVGARLLDVCDAVEAKIKELGGEPSFPAQTSRNEIAAHYCPEENDETVYAQGDVVKLDCGAHVEGYVTDNATTVDLGDNAKLVRASRDAVETVVKMAKTGVRISEIGGKIEEIISANGFSPVKNLSGHGVGHYTVHTNPSMPNYDNGNSNNLKEGQIVAIEPFASAGAGMIHESGAPTVFMQSAKRPIRGTFARLILKDIAQFNGLPFTTRWLSRVHGIGKVKFGLRELQSAGIIRGYPALPDVRGGLISQAEHTVIVGEKPIIVTKLDD